MDPLQWMGAVRMRVQTADKHITIIHTSPVHQLMSCEVKKLRVYKKQIHQDDFNFRLKYESSILSLLYCFLQWKSNVYKWKQF